MTASPTNSTEYREAIAKLTAEIAALDEERNKKVGELAKLQAERKLKLEAEIEAAIEAARQAKLQEWGATDADVGLSEPGKSKTAPTKKAKSQLPPKYRDPVTGATWNGRGSKYAPWVREAKANGTLDEYLIKP